MRSVIILLLLCLPSRANAQGTIHQDVYGDIVINGDGTYECTAGPNNICSACTDDIDTHSYPTRARLMLLFGRTGNQGSSHGVFTGTVSPFVYFDGVVVTPDLLPTESFFRSQIDARTAVTLGSTCSPQGLDYQVGTQSGFISETTLLTFDIPAEQASSIPFMFDFCDVFMYWGSGCNWAGSASRAWKLHLPGTMSAAAVSAGDPDPIEFAGQDIGIDFASAPGGTVTALQASGPPPVATPIFGPDGYWEVTTDMTNGSFQAMVTVGYDPTSLPAGTTPEDLSLARFDEASQSWQVLASTVDQSEETVTASTDGFSILALRGDTVVAVSPSSPSTLFLAPPSPNPASGHSTFAYRLPLDVTVRLELFDLRGRRVRTLVHAEQTAGEHEITWNRLDQHGRSVSHGLYFARLSIRGAIVAQETRRLTIVP